MPLFAMWCTCIIKSRDTGMLVFYCMQALHCAIERTLRTDIAEEWVHGVAVIQELLNRGANPNKLDGNSRTALTALKSLLLGPKDAHNGKEDIVRKSFSSLCSNMLACKVVVVLLPCPQTSPHLPCTFRR